MTTAAERRGLAHASKRVAVLAGGCCPPDVSEAPRRAEAAVLPPPPGERAEDEVTGAALVAVMDTYFAAMEDDLKLASAPATLKFGQVKDIRVNRVGRWCLITVKFKAKKDEPNEFTFRIGRPWAGVLSDRLARVLSR